MSSSLQKTDAAKEASPWSHRPAEGSPQKALRALWLGDLVARRLKGALLTCLNGAEAGKATMTEHE